MPLQSTMPYTPRTVYFHDGNYIRLLILAKGKFDDLITCHFEFASVFNLPRFEALSYRWGNQQDRRRIQLCGFSHEITKNLFTALHYLRYEDRERIMWIDALCINQENNAELNHQILHMQKIYSQAVRVVAWVGTEEWNGAEAFSVIGQQILQGTWKSSGFIDPSALTIIRHFFSNPYWDRLWIVQEIALASDIVVMCGHESLQWRVVRDLFQPNSKGQILPDGLPYHMRRGLWKVRHLWHTREGLNDPATAPTLLQILNKFNPCKCALSKDNIYAVLGMASAVVNKIIQPDYTENTTLEDVFRRATVACILEQQNLDVLSLIRRWTEYSRYTETGDIPKPSAMCTSWAGEWSTCRIIRPLLEPDLSVQLYAAAPPASGSFSSDIMFMSGSDHILRLRGILFDTLEEVSEQINPYESGWESQVRQWEPESLEDYKYPTGESGIDAFWRSLVHDITYATFCPDDEHKRNTPEHVRDYRQLYLKWTGRSISPGQQAVASSGHNNRSFKNCLEWGSNFNSLHGWTFCITKKGYFVQCQPDARPGDCVAFVYGSAIPLILRARESTSEAPIEIDGKQHTAWSFISSAYVHGLMDGEAFSSDQGYDNQQDLDIFLV